MRSSMAKRGPAAEGLAAQLLGWYDVHARVLPWRAPPGVRPNPYRVWLSEIMLQQTTVQAVRAYFERFLVLWPTVEALALAPLDDVLRAWAGLGYYARARNLHACAREVAQRFGGRFPAEVDALLSLPGIGGYTAGAIAAIAFDRPHAAVDGNVERVISRLHGIETPLPESKPEIRRLAAGLVPSRRAGDFAQAMMDLGATICTPRRPNCLICPWTEHCAGRASGLAPLLPRRRPKAELPVRRGTAFWVERPDGAVLLRRRAEKGLLGGMMEVPSTAWGELAAAPESHAPVEAAWRRLPGLVEHTFTHFRLELDVLAAESVDPETPAPTQCRWVAGDSLASEALPTVMRKIAALAQGVARPGEPPPRARSARRRR